MAQSTTPALLVELLDTIFSYLDGHSDLVNLACTSHFFKSLICPRHIEYRTIRTTESLPHVWKHLANRLDLARNIREVRFRARTGDRARYPTSLVDSHPSSEDQAVADLEHAKNVAKALGNMDLLRVFEWAEDIRDPVVDKKYRVIVLDALSKVGATLEELRLLGHGAYERVIHEAEPQSTWAFPKLRHLDVQGDRRLQLPLHMVRFLQSSRITALSLTTRPGVLHEIAPNLCLPLLRELIITRIWVSTMQMGTTVPSDTSICKFIQRHPSIESLDWIYAGRGVINSWMLPNLKKLTSSIVFPLECDRAYKRAPVPLPTHGTTSLQPQKWRLESIDAQVPIPVFIELQCIDRSALQSFVVNRNDTISDTIKIGHLFPNIKSLSLHSWIWTEQPRVRGGAAGTSVPNEDTPIDFVKEWVDLLSHFPKIEWFKDPGVPRDFIREGGIRHRTEMMFTLARRCPGLKEISVGFGSILIRRERYEGAQEAGIGTTKWMDKLIWLEVWRHATGSKELWYSSKGQ
ncbi:hypothetical protein BDN72DRAFT_849330 [Pluteus cervinus]|uniref:Uncharacterized protein n=1 Tax=Pluteus cervinus TaxID=181527 RepID=A0ACD3A8E0_9AGAR|nr:hypothetical protein BDN72DRAFT_849330 [Pluteus cervinus]